MKYKKYLCLAIMAAVVILELLPYGAVLSFANPEGEPFRETYAYFSLTPFGYANFAPFITALLSVVILLHIIVAIAAKAPGQWKAIGMEGAAATLLSFAPLLFGPAYYTLIALVISVLLALVCLLSLTTKKED